MQKHILVIIVVCLFLFTACSQPEVAPTAVPSTVPLTEPDPDSVTVVNYDLGEATIIQDHFPEDSPSPLRNMPVSLEGVIGVPEGEGQHPVVLIMHGSHVICAREDSWPCAAGEEQKNYEGFTYLVEDLAKAGYVALSINVNAEHTFSFGESPPSIRTAQLIDLHLGELAAANAGQSDKLGVDLKNRVDLSQMVWMGHSRGGDFANQIVREQGLNQSASPVGYGPVDGLLFIAPPIMSLDVLPTVDLPFSVVLPACDGDVVNLSGQGFYESVRLDESRTQPATSVYLEGANHNYFNAVLESETPDYQSDRPDCIAETSLTAVAQQKFLSQYTIDFLQTLFGETEQADAAQQRLGMDVDNPSPITYHNAAVRFNNLPPSADQLAIIQPYTEDELFQNLLGGDVTLNGVTAQFCAEGYYVPEQMPGSEPCKRVNMNQPGYPQQFVVSWATSDAAWHMGIPESEGDLTRKTAVQFRVALDPLSEHNTESQPQSFTLQLTDSSGDNAQVTIPTIDFPAGQRQPNEYFEGDSFSGHVYMNQVRIPLTEFTDIDLTQVAEISFIFDQTPSGTLFVTDLALVKD